MNELKVPQSGSNTPAEAFHELRAWTDERLAAKGLLPRVPQRTRQETSAITIAHIEQLKEDIAKLIKLEGRRSFWSGFAVNAFFFVLGLVAGSTFDFVKTMVRGLY